MGQAPRRAVAADDQFGPYRIVKEIGRGGQAVVYLAEDTRLPRRVALKVLTGVVDPEERMLKRFRREGEAASRLDHPGICTVFESGTAEGTPYLAMRYVEGDTLAVRLEAARGAAVAAGRMGTRADGADLATVPDTPTPPSTRGEIDGILLMIERVARALHEAHQAGIVHRDLKPANIMVTPGGEPVLLDFGIARDLSHLTTGLTRAGAVIGTPAYLAPEMLRPDSGEVDRRSDVFSLGVCLYECLTLRLPFDGVTLERLYQKILSTDPEDPVRLNPALPRDLRSVLDTVLEKQPDRRYQTALALAEDLRRVREREPVLAKHAGPVVRARRWADRNPALAASAAGILLSLAAGLGASLYLLEERGAALTERSAALAERTAALEERGEALAESEEQRRAGVALALASASAEVRDEDPMRALLLAREAVRAAPPALLPRAEDRLREALGASAERARFDGHSDSVTDVAWSPGGDLVVTTSKDNTVRLWDPAGRGSAGAVLRGHRADVLGATFSASGESLLTWSEDGTARTWGRDGTPVATIQSGAARVLCGVLTGDGVRLLAVDDDGSARLLDAEGRTIATVRDPSGPVIVGALSPRGDLVATTSEGGRVRVVDASGGPVAILRGHEGRVGCIAFSPEGDRVLTGSEDGTARVWDLAGAETLALRGHGAPVTAVSCFPGGEGFATGSMDGTARLWTREGAERLVLRRHDRPVVAVRVDPAGRRAASASEDWTARTWDLGGQEYAVFRDPVEPLERAWFVPSGDLVMAVTASQKLVRWFDPSGRSVKITRLGERLRLTDASADGARVVAGNADKFFVQVLSETGRELRTVHGRMGTAWMSPSGHWLATSVAGGMRLYVFEEGAADVDLPWETKEQHAFAYSPREDLVAFGTDDARVGIWDVKGRMLAECVGHTAQVRWVDFSASSDRIVSCGADGTARVFGLDGKERLVVRGHEGNVNRVWFLGGDGPLATLGEDGTVRTWREDGTPDAVIGREGAKVRAAEPSPDGTRIAAMCMDGTVRVFDPKGNELASLGGGALHNQGIGWSHYQGVGWSPGGERVLFIAADGSARAWTPREREVLALADDRVTREFSRQERMDYAALLGKHNRVALAAQDVAENADDGRPVPSEAADRCASDPTLDKVVIEAIARWSLRPLDEPFVRAEAARVLRRRPLEARRLNGQAWNRVVLHNRHADQVKDALRWVDMALEMEPESADIINTRGVVLYRLERFAEAVEELRRSDEMNTRSTPPGNPADAAFLAMAYHRTGDVASARASLERAHLLLADARNAEVQYGFIMRETEATLAQPPGDPSAGTK